MPILYMVLLPVTLLLLCCAYAALMMYKPEWVKSGVATFSILYAHAQTIQIFTQLEIRWPDPSDQLLSTMGVNLASVELVRPECLISARQPPLALRMPPTRVCARPCLCSPPTHAHVHVHVHVHVSLM